MPAKSPEEICRVFKQHMAEGNIDSVLSVYDPEAVFLNQSGEVKKGEEDLRQELANFCGREGHIQGHLLGRGHLPLSVHHRDVTRPDDLLDVEVKDGRISGARTDGEETNVWVRATVGSPQDRRQMVDRSCA